MGIAHQVSCLGEIFHQLTVGLPHGSDCVREGKEKKERERRRRRKERKRGGREGRSEERKWREREGTHMYVHTHAPGDGTNVQKINVLYLTGPDWSGDGNLTS